jgi:hypothetical protein
LRRERHTSAVRLFFQSPPKRLDHGPNASRAPPSIKQERYAENTALMRGDVTHLSSVAEENQYIEIRIADVEASRASLAGLCFEVLFCFMSTHSQGL